VRIATEYNPFCMVVGEPKIGKDTWVGAFTMLDGSGGLTIGERCNISSGVHIYTHDTVKRCIENALFDEEGLKNVDAIERSPVSIGDNVFIGANSVLLRGVSVGSYAVIGAGSVVKVGTEIGNYELWAGNPAKLIKRWMR